MPAKKVDKKGCQALGRGRKPSCGKPGLIQFPCACGTLQWLCADHLGELEARGHLSCVYGGVERPKGGLLPRVGHLGYSGGLEYFVEGATVWAATPLDRPPPKGLKYRAVKCEVCSKEDWDRLFEGLIGRLGYFRKTPRAGGLEY